MCLLGGQGLAQYEEMVFADYSTVIHIENIYEDVVVQALMKEINEGKALVA